jgi:lantibiotic modifying enzyme
MKEKIQQHITTIDAFISSYQNEMVTINGGLPGIVIFYFHLYETTQDEVHYDNAVKHLELLYDALENELPKSYVFSSGLAGLGWFFNYIQRFIDIENPFDTAEFDETFLKAAQKELAVRNYEFLTGFSGILLYLLRKESTDTSLLSDFISEVHDAVFELKNPISFFELKDNYHPHPSINLGVSHGIYGFVAILNKLHAQNIQVEKCEALLRFIINFTFQHEKDAIAQGYFFPNRIGKDVTESSHSRLAWCYGDLGILSVLYTSSQVLYDTTLKEKAVSMLTYTTHRKDMESNLMNDIWLCHGTSGAAHIFQRLYTTTGIVDCKYAADYWYRKTLAQLDSGSPQIKPNHTRSGSYARKDITGFLLGYTGLGLALLSKLEKTMDWDEMILMS